MKNKSEFSRKKIIILETAQKIFAQYGYQKTTIEDISNELGLTKSSLYYYYKSKESIFKDVIRYESNLYLERLSGELSKSSDPEEKLRIFCNQKMEHFQYMVNLHRLSLDAMHELRPIVQDLYKEFIEKEKTILVGQLKPLATEPDHLDTVADGIILMLESYKLQLFHFSNDTDEQKEKWIQLSQERLSEIIHVFYLGIQTYFNPFFPDSGN